MCIAIQHVLCYISYLPSPGMSISGQTMVGNSLEAVKKSGRLRMLVHYIADEQAQAYERRPTLSRFDCWFDVTRRSRVPTLPFTDIHSSPVDLSRRHQSDAQVYPPLWYSLKGYSQIQASSFYVIN